MYKLTLMTILLVAHWKLEEGVAEQFKGFGNQNVETRSLLLSDLNSDHFSQVSHKPSQSVSGRM